MLRHELGLVVLRHIAVEQLAVLAIVLELLIRKVWRVVVVHIVHVSTKVSLSLLAIHVLREIMKTSERIILTWVSI